MAKTIWKFPLELTDEQVLSMPENAEVLTVQLQGGIPCLWAIVIPGSPKESRTFEVHGTGQFTMLSVERRYIGTFQQPPFVWHVFERL